MSKAIQFFIIFMIPLMLVSYSSNAQCSRHGDGNKPKYYKAAIAAADDDDDEYTSQSSKKKYIRLDAIAVCELEALLIALSQLSSGSQPTYVENLETHFDNELNSRLFDDAISDLIFANANQQSGSYTKLYKLLIKSQFPLDREMGKQIKIALNGLKQTQITVSEATKRGTVLGVVLAALGSVGESSTYQIEAMKRGAYMGAFFAQLAEDETKISFSNWEKVQVELFNLPSPYVIK